MSPEDALDLGIINDGSEGSTSDRWDRRSSFRAGEDESSFGSIGEDQEGVWLTEHPIAMLTDRPQLWGAWSRWRAGVRDLTLTDAESLTAFDLTCHNTLRAAEARTYSKPEGDDDD